MLYYEIVRNFRPLCIEIFSEIPTSNTYAEFYHLTFDIHNDKILWISDHCEQFMMGLEVKLSGQKVCQSFEKKSSLLLFVGVGAGPN